MFIERVLILTVLALPSVASAQRTPTVDEIRSETRALLQSICGWQCDVTDVTIKTKPALPVGAVAPGFDDAPAARTVPAAIDLQLLLDTKLTATFRNFVTERVRSRIGEWGLPVTIGSKVTAFPERPTPPVDEPARPVPEPPPLQQPPPQPIIVQPPAPPPPPVQERPSIAEALLLSLIQALPLVLLALILAWTVLRVLRRYESFLGGPLPEEDAAAKPVTAVEAQPRTAPAPLPPPEPQALTAALRDNRSGTRRVFRDLIVRGEYDTVAHAVALLGDFVLADLPHDPAVRSALGPLGRRTAELLREPVEDEARTEVLRRVQAELIADRVAHPVEALRPELGALLGLGPEAFAALATRLPPRLRLVLLRHAPAHLVEAFLRGLTGKEHADVARSLLVAPAAEPSELAELAGAIERERPAALLSGDEADRVVDLLDTLPAAEQEQLLVTLEGARPDFVRRNLGQLPIESALLRVPDAALSRAMIEVPLDDWAAYLRIAPEMIRGRVLHACPARLKEPLQEELGLRVAADPARGAEARRRIIRAALAAQGHPANGAIQRPLAVEDREAHNARKVAMAKGRSE